MADCRLSVINNFAMSYLLTKSYKSYALVAGEAMTNRFSILVVKAAGYQMLVSTVAPSPLSRSLRNL